ncbi:metallophosphoesterase [Aquicoccus sp. G2-2]|uniref:metallophosphoesterase n=1 Tax=Aquicoccus sp. G2-2 TaxID=3092120 RepID=UPI002ADF7F29|nr:metallophosphoesterase [Aquicoccus sp. G2-2]MEA1115320.1 metallophosphoesterase [Aquicoccus sp. G2-2]
MERLMTRAWNIIPDIHADIRRLNNTLARLGNDAPVAFLGDFIDAGKNQDISDDAAVLTRVRKMIDSQNAVAVMGNHELNAILFHTLGVDGVSLRDRSDKNVDQHRSFVHQFGMSTPLAQVWIDWFLTLPLWHELDGLRLVHAFWGQAEIDLIAMRRPNGILAVDDLAEIAAEKTDFAKAVKALTTGPERKLPDGVHFHDFKGYRRHHVRIAWWRSGANTWREAALSIKNPDELPDEPLPSDGEVPLYPADAPPVLTGHYKMSGAPCIETPRAACLDYPDTPCAYRWGARQTCVRRTSC